MQQQPQPEVVGARDAEFSELEDLIKEDPRPVWPHKFAPSVLVKAVFQTFAANAKAEQLLEQTSSHKCEYLTDSRRAKRNRQLAYLDVGRRYAWEMRSSDFLSRCAACLYPLEVKQLYGALAMQHLLELDVADLSLPPDSRCSVDEYVDDINAQFFLDGTRGRFIIDGEVFHYASESGEVCDEVRSPNTKREVAFVNGLLAAVRRVTPQSLLRVVTMALSQSGIASLERGSLSAARFAVCGGVQEVEYRLNASSDGSSAVDVKGASESVMIHMDVMRSGFSSYLVASASGDGPTDFGPEAEPLPCDPDSSVRKSATISFSCRDAMGNLIVDVLDFVEVVDIRHRGQRIENPAFYSELPASLRQSSHFAFIAHLPRCRCNQCFERFVSFAPQRRHFRQRCGQLLCGFVGRFKKNVSSRPGDV